MKTFDDLVSECYTILKEQEAPAAPAAPPAPATSSIGGGAGDMGGDMSGVGSMGGGAPEGQGAGAEDMENEAKRDADPREYTRSILALLVDDKEGVTPEMFDDFIDSVSLAITKIKDKQGIKRFYGNFYKKLQLVLDLREELKSMFKQMSGTLDDLVGAQSEPDSAGGGDGMAGPSGPGVK
jgi:hypothetical protein